MGISIHALLAESDGPGGCWTYQRPLFLSTLSLRRATGLGLIAAGLYRDFYPRSPCGERPFGITAPHRQTAISIHALLAESDALTAAHAANHAKFLSTLSLRRATIWTAPCSPGGCISIHALLAESDPDGTTTDTFFGISIHALLAESDSQVFQRIAKPFRISIHALLAESDRALRQLQSALRYFYPRSPCGERLGGVKIGSNITVFLSTLSLRRATCWGSAHMQPV